MNKIYPVLYSKDAFDRVRVWWLEQKEGSYRTHSGIKDGQIVISDFTVATVKNSGKSNATTQIEQAALEIAAKYAKKVKTGYFSSINDINNITYVEPMLAQPLNKLSKKPNFIKEQWGMQCKLNGNRCIATKDGLFTRKGEKYFSVPHIFKSLVPFFEKHPSAVLDGELFNNDLRQQLNEISKLIRKTVHIEESDLINSEKLVRFYVYDGYNFTTEEDKFLDEESAYAERKYFIDTNIIYFYPPYLADVATMIVKSEEHMNQMFQSLLNDQQEGAILRKMDSPYEHKRSKNLVKVKTEQDSEAIIVDIQEGNGNWSGAATIVTLNWEGKTFNAVFKGDYETRKDILRNKSEWLNKLVTFYYMDKTGLGTPNFARIDPKNCFHADR